MKKIFVFCFAALIAAACAEKVSSPAGDETKKGFPYVLTATIANDNEPVVKANFTDPNPADPASATWSVQWKVGDEIHVFNQAGVDKTVIYTVTSVNAGVATFEPKEGEDLSKFSESTTYYAAKSPVAGDATPAATHPYLYNVDANNRGGINIGLSTYKSITEGTIDNDFFVVIAKAELTDGSLSFQFIPVVSYIRIEIPAAMSYNIGKFVFSATNRVSGYYRARMSETDNSIYELSQRYSGGSPNGPIFYGVGQTEVKTNPLPTFATGVYYIPVIPKCGIKKLVIYDTAGTAKVTRTFTELPMLVGKIYDFGTIPVNAD